MELVEVDGSILEGGGQILRIVMSLSVLMKRPVHITKIRGGRSKPGLRPQHLKGLELVQKISGGRLEGAQLESTEITFYPKQANGGEYSADTQTAGSVALLLQVALPCCLFSNSTTVLKLKGGTNAEMAPQFDYLTEVFRPILERCGASFDYKLLKRGYFPRGGGEVHVRVQPVYRLEPITLLERGSVEKIWGWSFVGGNLPIKLAQIMAESARGELYKIFPNTEINIKAYKENADVAVGSGSGINLIAQTSTGVLLGGSAIGKREHRPEVTGQCAAAELIEHIQSGGCLDRYSQDQVIIFMALAKGISQIKVGDVTEHTQTAIHVCEMLTNARFNIINKGPRSNIIRCTGIGLMNTKIM